MENIKGILMIRLCWMASLDYQDKYIVNHTIDEYINPEEIADMAYYALKQCLLPKNQVYFTTRELKALEKLKEEYDKYDDKQLFAGKTNYDFVYNNPAWAQIRTMSKEFIELCGFAIENFSYDN